MRLADNVAIVTGAGAGIGWAISQKLAAAGARVIGCDLDRASMDEVHQAITRHGRFFLPLVADVRHRADVEQLVQAALGAFGRLDIVVNNFGDQQLALRADDLCLFWAARPYQLLAGEHTPVLH
jgi:NAD(P)-dependent dehydrogenase (short-subunit alcohol dehydrogenase family)